MFNKLVGRTTAAKPSTAPSQRARLLREGVYVVALVLLLTAIVPLLLSAFWLKALTSAAVFALAAAGAALLYGRLGLVSLAQVALVGVGGWAALRLSYATPLPFELILLLSGAVAGLSGLVVGLPALRVRGLYLALITLMAAGAFQVIINYVQFPNGGSGMLGRTDGGGITMARPLLAQSDVAYFRYVIVVVALGFLLVEWHRRTRPGRAWALLSKSEACALSAGVNITLYKTWAFTLAGFLAGVAGGLLAGSIGQLDARTFPAGDSIMLFALTVVGGAYSWFGPILTGLLLRAVPALLTYLGLNADLALILFGAALLHALITAPTGIAGQIEGLLHRIRRRGDAP